MFSETFSRESAINPSFDVSFEDFLNVKMQANSNKICCAAVVTAETDTLSKPAHTLPTLPPWSLFISRVVLDINYVYHISYQSSYILYL